MIKLKPLYEIQLVSRQDLISVTPKGKEAVENFWKLNSSLSYFDLFEDTKLFKNDFQDWVARGDGGKLLEAAFNLTILIDEQIIEFDKPLPLNIFMKNWKKTYEDSDINKPWILNIFENGLLSGKI